MNIHLSDFIIAYDNVLTPEFCNKVCNKMDDDNRKVPGVTGGGFKPEVKDTVDLMISIHDDWKDIDSVFFNSLGDYIQKYVEDLKSKVNIDTSSLDFLLDRECLISDSGYMLQKYKIGGQYTWHHDYKVDLNSGTRVITYLWYLNEDFEGGSTEFIDGTVIKPKTGTLLIFPATWVYLHRGNKIVSGNKYISTGWISHKNKR